MSLRISTKGRYGIRAVSRIAVERRSLPVSLHTISREEHIPIHYLEQLLLRLRRKGLVSSIRGPKGGYVLNRRPDRISVAEILEALEGKLTMTDCIARGECSLDKKCILNPFWARLNDRIQSDLDNITLEELVSGAWEQKLRPVTRIKDPA